MFVAKRKFLPEVDYAKTYQPKNKTIWSKKLLSEFLGTILVSYLIGILGVRFQNGVKFEFLLTGDGGDWVSRLVVGCWVGMDILLCLILFSKMSCDLNPAITFYRWLSKENALRFAASKWSIQLLGAVAAAGLLLMTQEFSYLATGNELNSLANVGRVADTAVPALLPDTANLNPQFSAFTAGEAIGKSSVGVNNAGRHFAALGGEIVGTFLLIFPIFTRFITSHGGRDFVIVMLVVFGVATLLEIHTVGWNPARSLATNLAFDIASGRSESMQIWWAYLVGPFLAAFLMYYGNVLFQRHVGRLWNKIIFWKNIE